MSYYFCIVGTRDNPIYQADLASKPAGSTGPASFFSSSTSTTNNPSSATAINTPNTGISTAQSTTGTSTERGLQSANSSLNTSTGGVFGFGNALGAITGGLSGTVRGSNQSGTGNTTGGSNALTNTNTSSSSEGKGLGFGRYNDKHVLQMIAHSSLDVIEDKQFTNQSMYLKAVDRMNEWTTSALIVPGNIKFLILHEHKHDDGIRNFFYDVWELFVKITMNPFHDLNQPIQSISFDTKVRASARKHL